jgi:hypothetical protein
MLKHSYFINAIALLLFAACALPGFAQKKTKPASQPLPVTIVHVTKMDAQAKPNQKGKGRVIPVHIEYKIGSQEGVKLVELEAMLMTSNTDGTTTNVKKMLSNTGNETELMLEMPDGVFAKEFKLTMVANCAWDGGGGSARAMKTGSFPVPARQ